MKFQKMLHGMIRASFLAGTVLLLGGCASLPPTPLSATEQARLQGAWERHAELVRAIPDWECFGRAAIRAGDNGGTVNLNWKQTGTVSDVHLSAPLNQGTVELLGKPDLMVITDSAGHQRYTTDPAETVYQLTGWRIPITALPNWIRGLPNDNTAHYTWDEHGRLATLTDGAWSITYEQYEFIDQRVFLPTKLTLEHGDIRLRLAVERWRLTSDRKKTPS